MEAQLVMRRAGGLELARVPVACWSEIELSLVHKYIPNSSPMTNSSSEGYLFTNFNPFSVRADKNTFATISHSSC